jgi:hypothetical protein
MLTDGRGKAASKAGMSETAWSRKLFWSKVSVDKATGCWMWTGKVNMDGYGRCRTMGMNSSHRASYLMCVGPIPAGTNILHLCDTPACVNPSHLQPGTQKENMQQAARRGRLNYAHIVRQGSSHRMAKLDELDVMLIRSAYGRGVVNQAFLAEAFCTSQSNISTVVGGRTWTNLPVLTDDARKALGGK